MSYGDPRSGRSSEALAHRLRRHLHRGREGVVAQDRLAMVRPPTLTPPSARIHILSRHDMLRCDRKPAAHTMVWGSFLQANTLHERPHQPASITPGMQSKS